MGDKLKSLLRAIGAVFAWIWRGIRGLGRRYRNLYRGRRWWTKLIVFLLTLFLLLVFYVFAVMVNLFWLFGKSPSAYDIMHPHNAEASVMYSADGKVLGKFFDENRQSVSYNEINDVFFQALISTEAERFYSHKGIDIQGLGAAIKDAVGGHARGASTI